MQLIPLTQGQFAKVDDADFEWLNRWKWHASKLCGIFYAARTMRIEQKFRTICMHREILSPAEGMCCDHINRDGLDNRRSNLRVCTSSENARNRRKRTDNSSGFIGVTKDKTGRWCARIWADGKRMTIGTFDSAEEAARARDELAKREYGQFIQLNFTEY